MLNVFLGLQTDVDILTHYAFYSFLCMPSIFTTDATNEEFKGRVNLNILGNLAEDPIYPL